MDWKISGMVLVLVGFTILGHAQVSKSDVATVIGVLAADEMEGRKAGTEGAQKAATYIVGEFKKAGLQPMQDLNGHRHTFSMVERTPQGGTLSLNGESVRPAAFTFRFPETDLHITSPDGLDVVVVGPKENLRSMIGRLLNAEKATVILVNSAHKDFFSRLRSYLRGPDMVSGSDDQTMKLWVLTDETSISNIDFQAKNTKKPLDFTNVVGVLPGKNSAEMVMFSAHYDHLGRIQAVNGDDIANGADDDGSGVTALILLARHFAAGPQPERTLLFVGFSAEEAGTLGSRAFSKVVKPDAIVAGINIEMIGKPSKFGKGQVFMTGFERSDLGEMIQKQLAGSAFGLHPDPYPDMNLFFRSDNAPFARLGVPAHSFSTAQIDKDTYYHTVDDEIETLDMDHFTAAINAIAKGVNGLVRGTDTPRRLEIK